MLLPEPSGCLRSGYKQTLVPLHQLRQRPAGLFRQIQRIGQPQEFQRPGRKALIARALDGVQPGKHRLRHPGKAQQLRSRTGPVRLILQREEPAAVGAYCALHACLQRSPGAAIGGFPQEVFDRALVAVAFDRLIVHRALPGRHRAGVDHIFRLERLKLPVEDLDQVLDLRARLKAQTSDTPGAQDAASSETADAGQPEADASDATADIDPDALRREMQAQMTALDETNPDDRMVFAHVDEQAVAAVISDWTGIPAGRMMQDELDAVLNLSDDLRARVIGQDHGLKSIAKRIEISRAGLGNPNKPIGVFMLAGTSGVGKTETALALAEVLYGGEQNVITINMSEYQEAHTVSSLKGAPPGYVGYGEGGVLTEAVRRKPYSVVLLDEVEKAHPDVHEIFFQVFDKGVMEDGEGRIIDFKNTLILLTSNVGTETIMDLCSDPELMPDPEGMAKALRDPLLKVFPPALLGRLVAIPYYPLSPEMIGEITKLQLGRIQKRVQEAHGVPFEYSDGVVDEIVNRCQELDSGGRMIDAIVTNTMLPEISNEFLRRLMEGAEVKKVAIGVKDGEFSYGFD